MIRAATVSDIPQLLKMGAKFSEAARLIEHVGYDPDNMRETFAAMIEDENCAVFIGEAGAIGGQRGVHPFNHSHWIAQEMFWWSEGREGLRLLDAFETWAAWCCQSIRMITLDALNADRMGKLYLRRGYVPLEHGYIKRL